MIDRLKYKRINKKKLKYCGTCKGWVEIKGLENKNTWDRLASWCLSCSASYRASLKKEV